MAAFPSRALAAAQRGVAGPVLHGAAVVRREHDHRVVVDSEFVELCENLPGRPVDLFHGIAPSTVLRLAREPLGGVLGPVRHGVRQIQEERAFLVFLDKRQGLLGVALGNQPLVGLVFDHLFSAQQGQRRVAVRLPPRIVAHVVGKRYSKVRVEPMSGRQERTLVAQVPLAHAGRLVAHRLQRLGQCDFVRIETLSVARKQNPLPFLALI